MANGRFLSKTIALNEQLPEVSIEAALLFTWSIPHLDRDGRMKGNPALIKAAVCPLVRIDSGSIPDLLTELVHEGLIRWYEEEGVKVVEFPRFREHQQGMKYDREAASRLPAYTSDSVDLSAPDQVRSKSGLGPDQVLLSEVKGSEVKGSEQNPTSPSGDVSNRFEEVWAIHRKGPKKNALAEYRKAVPSRVTHEALLSSLRAYVKSFRGDFTGQHLFRWIRDSRWQEQANGTKPESKPVTRNPTPWIT